MTLPIPVALTRGVSLRVADYTETELTAAADASGIAITSTDYLPQGQWWRVERVVIQGNSARSCAVILYQGDAALPQRARDWTRLPAGNLAIAEYPAFLTIYPTSCLTFAVAGASPGDVFTAAIQYQLVVKTTGQAP